MINVTVTSSGADNMDIENTIKMENIFQYIGSTEPNVL
jgi:hypothetical protein